MVHNKTDKWKHASMTSKSYWSVPFAEQIKGELQNKYIKHKPLLIPRSIE